VILSPLTVTMEHIGLSMTSSSFHILAAVLHKTKSISFEYDDYDNYCNHILLIIDSLATTTVLEQFDCSAWSFDFFQVNLFDAERNQAK